MTHRLTLLVSFVCIFLFTACSAESSDEVGTHYLIGDSIAFGMGASAGHDLGSCLGQNLDVRFLNRAVPGATSRDLLARLEKIARAKPKTVILSVGGNDVLVDLNHIRATKSFSHAFSPQETLVNLRAIFTRLRAAGSQVVYLDMSPPLRLTDVRSIYALYDGRLRAIRAMTKEFPNVTLVKHAMRDIWGHQDLMFDTLHPNDAGYSVLCRRVLNAAKL